MNETGGVQLSVVIPTLNEAARLPALLRQLRAQQGVDLEIIVADGGSTDATVTFAQASGVQVVQAPPGRAKQMNASAAVAHAPFLLFLHADSELTAPRLLAEALAALQTRIATDAQDRIAGHFPLRFARRGSGHEGFFRYLEEKTLLNRPYTINGDQGCLLSARYFRELGGFDERLPYLEDQRLAARVWETGQWLVLPGNLITSARRFETEGHWARYRLMAIIMALYAAGVEEFFARATGVYATQDQTGRLRLRPYVRLVQQILWERRWRKMVSTLLRVGRFVRENAWQIFFCCDVRLRPLLGPGRYPFLRGYDLLLDPLLRNRVADALAAVLVCGWFFLWLPLTRR